jgi:hypothetical protein
MVLYNNICDDDFIQLDDGIDYLGKIYKVVVGRNSLFEKQKKVYFIVEGPNEVSILNAQCQLLVKYQL